MKNLYDQYFTYFDNEQKAMAASLPALSYCVKLIDSLSLSKILDLGSGVSTVVFSSRYKQLTSVDTQEKWAKQTEKIIKDLLGLQISVHTDLATLSNETFDFVFYDYGNLEDRIFNFPKLLSLDVPYIYLDDMHILPYRYYVESRIKTRNITFLPETIDEFGRFGALLTQKQKTKSGFLT